MSIANTRIRREHGRIGWSLFERRKIHKNEVGIYVPQSKRCTGSPKSEVTGPLPIRQVIINLVNNGQCALTNSSHMCLIRI